MKKIVLGLAAILLILTLAGCPALPGTQGTTLTQTLNAGGDVDLKSGKFSENAAINTAGIKVSNADLGGKTLTVNKAGVTLENIKNANLVIGEGVGNGDVFIDNCSFNKVTVNGGGANSIHFKKTTVTHVVVSKEAVRVVLEESTTVTTAQISGNGAKLEAAENAEAKVATLEVAPDTTGVQIQKVEATKIVLKDNVADVKVSDVKADTLEIQSKANVILEGDTQVETAELKGDNAKVEAAENATAKVATLEVAPNTNGIQVQKIEATKVVVKENVKNVTISEVKADTLEVKEKAENTTITSTKVKTIEIEKEVEKIKIEACAITEAAIVSNAAGSVEVSGSKIEKLQVVKTKTTAEIKAVITVTKSESDTVINNAEVVVSGGKVTTQPITVVVADDVDTAALDVPETVAAVTIESVDLDVSRMNDIYKTGAAFDKSNAFLVLTYSDGTENSIAVNPDDLIVEGFDSSNDGVTIPVTVKTTYNRETVEGQLDVTIAAKPDYIGQGVNMIMSGRYDDGVAKFREYYTEYPDSDEAKLFYALAELAAVSTDESIADLLIDNFGFEEYPATMNALINGDWLADVQERERIYTYDFEKCEPDNYVAYIRCDIDETKELYDYRISYLYDEEYGYWISPQDWDDVDNGYSYTDLYITGVAKPSDTGRYMVYRWDVTYPTKFDPEAPDYELPEDISYWDYHNSTGNYILSNTFTSLPKIKMTDWFKETAAYKNSLIKGVENTDTLSLALAASFLDCNPDGINDLLDDCIAVFESDKIKNARAIVNSMESNIIIPESIITTFNLEEMLGEDEIEFGKAEFNILLSALDIVKGTLQLISSYDLSLNLYELKKIMKDDLDGPTIEIAENLINEKTLAPRSDADSRVANAKNSYVGALDTILESYTVMFGENGYYPAFISEMVTPYADEYLPGVTALRDAISNGGVFYLPGVSFDKHGDFVGIPSWNNEVNEKKDFGIDFGKIFTPGYLSDFMLKDDTGKARIYIQYDVDYYYYGSQNPEKLNPGFTFEDSESDGSYYRYEYSYESTPVLADESSEEDMMKIIDAEFQNSGYTDAYVDFYCGYMCSTKVLTDLFVNPPSSMTDAHEYEILPIVDSNYYSWDSYYKKWNIH